MTEDRKEPSMTIAEAAAILRDFRKIKQGFPPDIYEDFLLLAFEEIVKLQMRVITLEADLYRPNIRPKSDQ